MHSSGEDIAKFNKKRKEKLHNGNSKNILRFDYQREQ